MLLLWKQSTKILLLDQVPLGQSSTLPNSYWNFPSHAGRVRIGNRVSPGVSTITQISGDLQQLFKSESLATLGEERYLVCENNYHHMKALNWEENKLHSSLKFLTHVLIKNPGHGV